jgi:hypothetical protein
MSYTKEELEPFRFPIGRFTVPSDISKEDREKWIENLKSLPQKMRNAVQSFSEEQLNTPYRPDGWTVRQLTHHIVDSHLNCYIRYKWALTENNPTIKAYNQNDWSKLPDALEGPIEMSLNLLEAVHYRLTYLMDRMGEKEWKKTFVHPESGREVALDINLSLYSWHSDHHLAHITGLIKRMNW